MLTPSLLKYLKYNSNGKVSRRTASLNQYLHRFKKVDNPHFPTCGHPKEMVEDYLLQCPSYAHNGGHYSEEQGEAPSN